MPRRKKASALPDPTDNPKTIQRTYRFDTKLFDAFEDDCATHLSNPKRVIEALILHWLDADSDERAAMAHKHRERIGSASRDEE
jgi:Fe-S-cluster formation regulator IscX/YfhJ